PGAVGPLVQFVAERVQSRGAGAGVDLGPDAAHAPVGKIEILLPADAQQGRRRDFRGHGAPSPLPANVSQTDGRTLVGSDGCWAAASTGEACGAGWRRHWRHWAPARSVTTAPMPKPMDTGRQSGIQEAACGAGGAGAVCSSAGAGWACLSAAALAC